MLHDRQKCLLFEPPLFRVGFVLGMVESVSAAYQIAGRANRDLRYRRLICPYI